MARPDRRKGKPQKVDYSRRMNHLKAEALSQVARQSWARNERHKTIALLTEAARREPRNVHILLELAAAHGRQRNYDKAEELLGRLIQLAPRKASIYRRVAQTYAIIDRLEKAEEYYRQALELCREDSAKVPILLELASLFERRHRLADASAAVDEALARTPAHHEASFQRAFLWRREEKFALAESRLRGLASDADCPDPIRADAWYELAQLLDQLHQYDEAFACFVSAKQILKSQAAPYQADYRQTLAKSQEIVQTLGQQNYDRWHQAAQDDTPYRCAVLTGHPRSGTTLIEQVLDSHPEVTSADELDVFAEWIYLPIVRKFPPMTPVLSILDRVPAAIRQQARGMYWRQTEAIFAEPIGSRLLLDKNPGVTMLLPIINWAFPEMKMLIALRDPRDVVLSCFMQRLRLTTISSNWLSLSAAVEYYARMMESWLAVRRSSRTSWLEFRYEDVVADLPAQARRILQFLEIPWDDRVLEFHEHARSKIVRSPTYNDVTQPVYQKAVGRWQHYAKYLEPVLAPLQPFIHEFGY